MTTAFETTHSDFRVLGLKSAEVELRCAPALGGRLFSLVSRRTGREWLWRRQEGPELFNPADPADFRTGTYAGLDECMPTVGACTWRGGEALADHGAAWAREWTVENHGGSSLDLAIDLPGLGLRFERRIRLEGPVVRFEYALENSSTAAAPALWAMHPLFTLAEGDRLELPAGVRELLFGGARPALPVKDPQAPVIAFPEPAPGVRLDALALADVCDGFLKCFTPAQPAGRARAALANPPTGDRLEVHWDTAAAPFLGLWLTRGGYRGWHHVALEPTNAPFDRVDEAAADPRYAAAVVLPPGTGRKWWVEWRVG